MKLSYECNQDPRKMPTRQGKKFCDHCNRHVHDLRRKSDEKIERFAKENPKACVIAYGHQLDKINRFRPKQKTRSYFPYAAGIIAVALLPSLSYAQNDTVKTNQAPVTIVPIVIPDQVPPKKADQAPKNATATPCFIRGKVKVGRKQNLKGTGIVIYRYAYAPDGKSVEQDTLAVGELNAKGKFMLKISNEQFDRLRDTRQVDLNIRIYGFERETIDSMIISGNTATLAVSAEEERFIMGLLLD
jgi:hypothetical protein